MKKKSFGVALGKDNAKFEDSIHHRVLRGEIPLPSPKKLASLRGVIKKKNGLYLNQRMMPQEIHHTLTFTSGLALSERRVQRQADERTALIRQLKKLGHKILIADFNEGNLISDKRKKRAANYGKLVKSKLPIRSETEGRKEVHPNVMWMRDMWKKVGRERVHFLVGKTENLFGEGGTSVDLPKNGIILSQDLRNNSTVNRLMKKGYKFYFMADGYRLTPVLSRFLKKNIFASTNHVDLFVGAVGKFLLVDPQFYTTNRNELRRAAKESNLEIIFVPQEEAHLSPSNFLHLADNTILMAFLGPRRLAIWPQ